MAQDNLGVLDKALSVLETLACADEGIGPTELSHLLTMNKSTVFRMLTVLCKRGYATKDANGKYKCGAKLIEIASNYINSLELQVEAKPYLVMLYSELGMPVHLGTMEGKSTVYIEKLDLYADGPKYAQVGYTTPAYCSSIGKCILASLSSDDLDNTLSDYIFKSYTPNTITSAKEFRLHLKEVRKQGWAMDNEEYMPDSCCIGAPVYDFRGDVIACVSVSGTKAQFEKEHRPILVEKVKQTAREISKRMGYVLS